MTKRSRLSTVALALALLVGLGLTACSDFDPNAPRSTPALPQTNPDAVTPGTSASSTTPTPSIVAPVSLSVVPDHGVEAALPTDSLAVTVSGGELTDFSVATAKGVDVPGKLTDGAWKPDRNFIPHTDFVATGTVVNAVGAATTKKVTFSTLTPESNAWYDILYDTFQVGVGMPATIQFATAVETKEMRAEVERHVSVTTTPTTAGSWGWLDNRQLMWRPAKYWKPGTKVAVKANLAGIQTGTSKWIDHDASGGFTIGASRISYVNIATHEMTVTRDGKVVKRIPVTNGKTGFITRSGTKVIIERHSAIRMDSETIAIPAGSRDSYSLNVKWALRVTWTGEFVHAAPWSAASHGVANVSHGCTGMSTANAKWFFDFSRAGDIVQYTGSNRR
ncbi:MAG TPA: Ig-like domain-containing protein, partial [Propionibacteriaceae bacterium]|nr:Ig-like domain-containing protein [Propionibacteriaceae bacterium]